MTQKIQGNDRGVIASKIQGNDRGVIASKIQGNDGSMHSKGSHGDFKGSKHLQGSQPVACLPTACPHMPAHTAPQSPKIHMQADTMQLLTMAGAASRGHAAGSSAHLPPCLRPGPCKLCLQACHAGARLLQGCLQRVPPAHAHARTCTWFCTMSSAGGKG